jgi:DNA (cytosine-5)-methyltransferase 1
MGLHRAGYKVTGVDSKAQPNYPFEFVLGDALEWLHERNLWRFDLIWASPPCQAFTQMNAWHRGKGGRADSHPDLLTPTLAFLRKQSVPWIVENVQGARRLMRPVCVLHGGMFSLGVHRPRLFESNLLLFAPKMLRTPKPIGVYGHRPDGQRTHYRNNGNYPNGKKSIMRVAKSLEEAQVAMDIDWMTWPEIREAVPPAYSEYLARQLHI